MEGNKNFEVANLALAKEGRKKIAWAKLQMPVLSLIQRDFLRKKPLAGLNISCCLHITSETANLVLTLLSAGAKVFLCASNPLSTQDSIAASLVKDFGVSVFAFRGEDKETYYRDIDRVLAAKPQLTMDDGADLIFSLHQRKIWSENSKIIIEDSELGKWEFIGSSEETTTGVVRLKAMAKNKKLKVPVIAVNNSATKHLFDNRYGTGQSTVDGVLRATNVLLAGKKVVVCGYGWCGRGIATRMRGMGALVTVVEVSPLRALEAVMDGFSVEKIGKAVSFGDIFITATGNKNVISQKHFPQMKDGAILANSGHFNVEFDYEGLKKMAIQKKQVRPFLEEFTLPSGKKIFALGEGRLINLVAAEGHPSAVMDLSFANQALAAVFLVENQGKLRPEVYTLPAKIDETVARLKLKSLGVALDRLTREQKRYLEGWQEGT